MAAHTPGPWEVEDGTVVASTLKRRVPVTMADGEVRQHQAGLLALVYAPYAEHGVPPLNHDANAHLIAAAPELLEALRDMTPPVPSEDAFCHRGLCPQNECAYCVRILRAHAAIAKAEGRQVEAQAVEDAERWGAEHTGQEFK